MRRRVMLGVPALAAAAAVVVAAGPAEARPRPEDDSAPECLADLLKES